jgi:hypothetical protein
MVSARPTPPSNATPAPTPSLAFNLQRAQPNATIPSYEQKRIHVTLSLAPWLSKDEYIEKESVWEICLEKIEDGQKVTKASCCHLLAHR